MQCHHRHHVTFFQASDDAGHKQQDGETPEEDPNLDGNPFPDIPPDHGKPQLGTGNDAISSIDRMLSGERDPARSGGCDGDDACAMGVYSTNGHRSEEDGTRGAAAAAVAVESLVGGLGKPRPESRGGGGNDGCRNNASSSERGARSVSSPFPRSLRRESSAVITRNARGGSNSGSGSSRRPVIDNLSDGRDYGGPGDDPHELYARSGVGDGSGHGEALVANDNGEDTTDTANNSRRSGGDGGVLVSRNHAGRTSQGWLQADMRLSAGRAPASESYSGTRKTVANVVRDFVGDSQFAMDRTGERTGGRRGGGSKTERLPSLPPPSSQGSEVQGWMSPLQGSVKVGSGSRLSSGVPGVSRVGAVVAPSATTSSAAAGAVSRGHASGSHGDGDSKRLAVSSGVRRQGTVKSIPVSSESRRQRRRPRHQQTRNESFEEDERNNHESEQQHEQEKEEREGELGRRSGPDEMGGQERGAFGEGDISSSSCSIVGRKDDGEEELERGDYEGKREIINEEPEEDRYLDTAAESDDRYRSLDKDSGNGGGDDADDNSDSESAWEEGSSVEDERSSSCGVGRISGTGRVGNDDSDDIQEEQEQDNWEEREGGIDDALPREYTSASAGAMDDISATSATPCAGVGESGDEDEKEERQEPSRAKGKNAAAVANDKLADDVGAIPIPATERDVANNGDCTARDDDHDPAEAARGVAADGDMMVARSVAEEVSPVGDEFQRESVQPQQQHHHSAADTTDYGVGESHIASVRARRRSPPQVSDMPPSPESSLPPQCGDAGSCDVRAADKSTSAERWSRGNSRAIGEGGSVERTLTEGSHGDVDGNGAEASESSVEMQGEDGVAAEGRGVVPKAREAELSADPEQQQQQQQREEQERSLRGYNDDCNPGGSNATVGREGLRAVDGVSTAAVVATTQGPDRGLSTAARADLFNASAQGAPCIASGDCDADGSSEEAREGDQGCGSRATRSASSGSGGYGSGVCDAGGGVSRRRSLRRRRGNERKAPLVEKGSICTGRAAADSAEAVSADSNDRPASSGRVPASVRGADEGHGGSDSSKGGSDDVDAANSVILALNGDDLPRKTADYSNGSASPPAEDAAAEEDGELTAETEPLPSKAVSGAQKRGRREMGGVRVARGIAGVKRDTEAAAVKPTAMVTHPEKELLRRKKSEGVPIVLRGGLSWDPFAGEETHRVAVWNRKKRRMIEGRAAPQRRELRAFLSSGLYEVSCSLLLLLKLKRLL